MYSNLAILCSVNIYYIINRAVLYFISHELNEHSDEFDLIASQIILSSSEWPIVCIICVCWNTQHRRDTCFIIWRDTLEVTLLLHWCTENIPGMGGTRQQLSCYIHSTCALSPLQFFAGNPEPGCLLNIFRVNPEIRRMCCDGYLEKRIFMEIFAVPHYPYLIVYGAGISFKT